MTMVAAAFDERPLAFFWRFHRRQVPEPFWAAARPY
jgi:hypothetical protein